MKFDWPKLFITKSLVRAHKNAVKYAKNYLFSAGKGGGEFLAFRFNLACCNCEAKELISIPIDWVSKPLIGGGGGGGAAPPMGPAVGPGAIGIAGGIGGPPLLIGKGGACGIGADICAAVGKLLLFGKPLDGGYTVDGGCCCC